MIKIEEVPVWLIMQGVGHIVAWSTSGWHYTACRKYTPSGEKITEIPKRKCRACMEMLDKLKPSDEIYKLPPVVE